MNDPLYPLVYSLVAHYTYTSIHSFSDSTITPCINDIQLPIPDDHSSLVLNS